MRPATVLRQEARPSGAYTRYENRLALSRYRYIVRPFFLFTTFALAYTHILIKCKLIRRPKGTLIVSPADRDLVSSAGLAVVECSWARLDDVPWRKIASPHERLRTPLLFLIEWSSFPLTRSRNLLLDAASRVLNAIDSIRLTRT